MVEWQAVKDEQGWSVVSETGSVLARVQGVTDIEAELNARLMAAAPILREIARRPGSSTPEERDRMSRGRVMSRTWGGAA